jgi:L-aspartate oxidase
MNVEPMFPRYLFRADLTRLPHNTFDFLVVGSGIAGLSSALSFSSDQRVLVVSKGELEGSNTYHAQGGIAAVLDERDSTDLHFTDTMRAGAGLSEPAPVRSLVEEGPQRVREMLSCGVPFDKERGNIALTKEGAHSRRRIWHANGDATGKAIVTALLARARQQSNITLKSGKMLVDLITLPSGQKGKLKLEPGRDLVPFPRRRRCLGALFLNQDGTLEVVWARGIILATGGAGQLYEYTTNPELATGGGLAIALRAGATLADLEFFQFHPTALYLPPAPRFLISEAVRGEGAILRNIHGERFMPKYHKLAELAPRDVVSRVIMREIKRTASKCVFLDLSALSPELILERFPTIHQRCLRWGLDITQEMIPVAPAAHYLMGGVCTDLSGRTGIRGLYAAGEVACTGVHGANRLASNSLVEGAVFGRRAALSAQADSPTSRELAQNTQELKLLEGSREFIPEARSFQNTVHRLQRIMSDYVGMERDGEHLALGEAQLADLLAQTRSQASGSQAWVECENMLTGSIAIAKAALMRQESRGGHERLDFPARDDQAWQSHILMTLK